MLAKVLRPLELPIHLPEARLLKEFPHRRGDTNSEPTFTPRHSLCH